MASFLTLHNVSPAIFLHQTATTPATVNRASGAAGQAVSPATATPARSLVMPATVRSSVSQSTINPALIYLRNPIVGGWQFGRPQPRSAFSLPTLISPVTNPTDQTLFEEPQDATKKHYLPQYGIATRGSGGSMVKWVSFAPTAQGFVLTVHLADVTSPSLSTNNTPATPNSTRYMLTANLQGRAASWDFGTANTDQGVLVLTLTVTDLGDRNSIYHAMTDSTAQAQLIIRRSVDIAALVPPPSSPPGTPPPAATYRENVTAIDSSIPFTFDVELDKNVFAQLTGVSGGQGSLNIQPVSWQGRPYPYYQDPNQPSQVYFLPDAFKISRQATVPHVPNIIVSTNGSDPSTLTFTISFLAVPVWDPNRLTAAASALQNIFLLDAPPSLSLLEATNTALALTLPSSDASSAPGLAPQPGANIDIAAGIKCSVTLSLPQFQQVYAALFDRISQLLSGVVTVTVDSDIRKIPFVSSAADFAGDIFDTTTNFDPTKNQFVVTLGNSIESLIHVDALPAALMKSNQQVAGTVEQIAPALPIDVAPVNAAAASSSAGSSSSPAPVNNLTVTLQLAAGTTVDQTCSVLFDFSHTHVLPDPNAIWEAIMQNQMVGPVNRPVKVMVFASIFNQPAPSVSAAAATSGGTSSTSSGSTTGLASSGSGTASGSTPSSDSGSASASDSQASAGSAPGQASSATSAASGGGTPGPATATPAPTLMAVQVVFENGQTVNFDPSTPATAGIMTQTVNLAVPVKMFVLQDADAAYYKYRLNIITSAGTQQGDWVSSNQDSFYVQVNS